MWYLFLVPLLSTCFATEVKKPLVETPFGAIEGFVHKTDTVDVDVFLGIRYARAPDHIYRFERPQIVEKWAPIIHHATYFRAACIPYHRVSLMRENHSEDCLFLNIVRPRMKEGEKPKKLLPVIVFIHGGGFELGDTEMIGYKKAAENFVSKDVIFVSIQYRLGALGFFTTGDNVMPGNMGLWDQTMALQFLQDVLESFGGDPNRVTLAGHSAGSSSVAALLYSPHSDALFSQAIEMSGSVFAEYSMSETVIEESRKLADTVGCKMQDSKELLECMKEKTMEEIMDGMDKIGKSKKHSNFIHFHPHFDGEFFPFEIEDMVRKAPKKPTMQGVTDSESALFVLLEGIGISDEITISLEKRSNFTREDFMDFVTTGVVTEHEFGRKMGPLLQMLTEFYLEKSAPEEKDSIFYLHQYSHLLSDLMFSVPIFHEIELKRNFGWNPYFYVIDYVSESSKQETDVLEGAYHGSELRFVLEFMGLEKLPLNEDDKKFQDAMLSTFINFIKSGNPSTETLKWEPASKENPVAHMRFNGNSGMSYEHYREEAMNFWLKTVPKAIGADILKKGRLPAAKAYITHTEL